MFKSFQLCSILVMVFTVTACSKPTQETSPNQVLVQSYLDAYNAQSLDAMALLMHDDIEWINIEGSEKSVITQGKDILVSELSGYFSPDFQSGSSLSDWNVNGQYVSAMETVAFTRQDGTLGSQASISVYQLENGLIRRVWYFPAQ